MLAALGGYTFVYACMNCHASVYVPFKKLGGGDIFKGLEKMNQMPYFDARKIVSHPVACTDGHDSQTMQLRVTRPAFVEEMRTLKASQGVEGYDVNTMARPGRRCARSSAASATSSTTSRGRTSG